MGGRRDAPVSAGFFLPYVVTRSAMAEHQSEHHQEFVNACGRSYRRRRLSGP